MCSYCCCLGIITCKTCYGFTTHTLSSLLATLTSRQNWKENFCHVIEEERDTESFLPLNALICCRALKGNLPLLKLFTSLRAFYFSVGNSFADSFTARLDQLTHDHTQIGQLQVSQAFGAADMVSTLYLPQIPTPNTPKLLGKQFLRKTKTSYPYWWVQFSLNLPVFVMALGFVSDNCMQALQSFHPGLFKLSPDAF